MSSRTAATVGLAALGLLTALPATAAEWPEVYLGVGIGANYAADSDLGAPASSSIEHDIGWGIASSIGLKWFDRVRTELEVGARSNGVDSVGGLAGDGDMIVSSYMLNVLYDVPTAHKLSPYFGVGAGLLRGTLDKVRPIAGFQVSDADSSFGYQGIAGLNYKLNDAYTLFADYRYTRADDLSFSLPAGDFDADWASHSLLFGFRVSLWKPAPPAMAAMPVVAPAPVAAPAPPPPPAPVAAPAPAAPRMFMVFFDFDKADLTPQAKQILAQAAENAKKGGVSRLVLTGHADRSGTDRYNLLLSERRANAVRDEMVRLGVAASGIATDFKGESQPLVPTADGVREPQNRRVEIKFN